MRAFISTFVILHSLQGSSGVEPENFRLIFRLSLKHQGNNFSAPFSLKDLLNLTQMNVCLNLNRY